MYRFRLVRGRSSTGGVLRSIDTTGETLSAVQGKPCPFGDLSAAPRPGQIGGELFGSLPAMAPPKEKIAAAIRAMKAIGIPKHTVKPVLKNLLIVYENNWEYIEAENFRVLADAVLDLQESKVHTISLSGLCISDKEKS
uniref:WIYLD domain-containing protein n=1 Tax=Ananas comosus var. bracteatus TaxID=296719 RepID=A0A6V7QMR6_ANACO|nr:unnamed protein product [Ananas comosus var. bracteatus]